MVPASERKEPAACHPSYGYFLLRRLGRCRAAVVRVHCRAAPGGRPECGRYAKSQPGLSHAEQASRAWHLHSRTQVSFPGAVARDPAAKQPKHSVARTSSPCCWRLPPKESRRARTRIRASTSRRNSSSQNRSRAIPITFCGRSTNSMPRAGVRRSWTNPGCARSPGASKKSRTIADLNLSTKRTATRSPRPPSHRRSSTTCS